MWVVVRTGDPTLPANLTFGSLQWKLSASLSGAECLPWLLGARERPVTWEPGAWYKSCSSRGLSFPPAPARGWAE